MRKQLHPAPFHSLKDPTVPANPDLALREAELGTPYNLVDADTLTHPLISKEQFLRLAIFNQFKQIPGPNRPYHPVFGNPSRVIDELH